MVSFLDKWNSYYNQSASSVTYSNPDKFTYRIILIPTHFDYRALFSLALYKIHLESSCKEWLMSLTLDLFGPSLVLW